MKLKQKIYNMIIYTTKYNEKPFKSISKLFTKGNAIGNTAKSMFSKSNMNTFRNTLQDTLNQQGDVLKRSAVLQWNKTPYSRCDCDFSPELLPFVAGVAGVGALTGGIGMVETSGLVCSRPNYIRCVELY
jgi:hypothetical protein